ncbi:hypothetical protein [Lentzea xinjiangensis]|uniref:hypothetical protein n=1 Tax=Lentzea xinjiangensis TaxID=402600 RepID=UPI002481BE3F|nr:hypothetical protein [Lentzea xinjiangensis]
MNNAGTAPVLEPDSAATGSMSNIVPTSVAAANANTTTCVGMTRAGQQSPPRTRRQRPRTHQRHHAGSTKHPAIPSGNAHLPHVARHQDRHVRTIQTIRADLYAILAPSTGVATVAASTRFTQVKICV